MKKYSINIDGKIIFKNVSPENEEAFFAKYGRFNPELVPDPPGKSEGTSQSQKFQEINTEYSSGPGSSGSVKYKLNGYTIDVDASREKAFLRRNPTAGKVEGEPTAFTNWWNETWLGGAIHRGKIQASDTGEAAELMKIAGKDVDLETVKKWMVANREKADLYEESKKMIEFSKQYEKEGRTWGAFFRGVKRDPALMAELLIQSYSTMYHTFKDSEDAQLKTTVAASGGAAVGAGATAYGFGLGAIPMAMYTGMGALAASMESSLAFGEFIQEELNKQGKEFTDENVLELLQGESGKKIKNRAVGRGVTIGLIETVSGGLATKATGAVLKSAKAAQAVSKAGLAGAKITERAIGTGAKIASGFAGLGVEAIGGGLGEVGGRVVAGQDMDAAEIGFEAITGTASAPLTVGLAMGTYKPPVYMINGERVDYNTMNDFIETADSSDVASADIEIENDTTGLDKKAKQKQNSELIKSQIDPRVNDENDINEIVKLEQQLNDIDQKTESGKNLAKNIKDKIKQITDKYSDVDITSEDVVKRREARFKVKQDFVTNRLGRTIKFAEDNAKLIGKDVIVAESNVDAQATYDMAMDEFNTRVDEEIQSVQNDQSLSEEEKGNRLTELENSKISTDNVAGADGFIVGDVIVINKDIAGSTGAINVGAHELFHGIVRKHMDNINEQERTKLITDFVGTLTTNQKKKLQEAINNRNTEFGENIDINSSEEVLTMFSDLIATNQITFDEGVFSKIANVIQEVLRRLGVRKEFANGRQVYNFMKDYQKSIEKGKISKRAEALADGGAPATGAAQFSRSVDTKKMSEAIDRHVPKDITTNEQYLTKDSKTKLSPHDNVMVEIISNGTLDGYLNQLITRDKSLGGVVSRDVLLDDTKFELLRKIRSEYKPVVDGNFRSLFSYIYGRKEQVGTGGIAIRALGNMKKKYLQRPDAGAAPLEVKTSEGIQTRQIEDTTTEPSIDTQDLGIKKRAREAREAKKSVGKKGLLEQKQTGKFVNKEYSHSNKTNTSIKGVVKETNYDVSQPYESIKDDMMSMENATDVRTGVKPTGILFKAFDTISQEEFGVKAKSIMARKQTLDRSENIAGREAIAKRAKKEKSLKKYLEKILPDRNYNPKTKKSIGTWAGLIRSLYTDAVNENGKPIRIDNIRGRVLNLDKFTEAQLAEMFGLTPDYKLLPYKKGFKDGMIKGVVVSESVLTINQAARVAAKQPASAISIGKPSGMFSRTSQQQRIQQGMDMTPTDFVKYWSKKSGIPIEKLESLIKYQGKKSSYDAVYDKKTGETMLEVKARLVRDFLKEYPQWRDYLMRSGIGGMSRSTFGGKSIFEPVFSKKPGEKKVTRLKYLDEKKQKLNKINLTKEQQLIENKKTEDLKNFYIAIQEFLNKQPESAVLFISLYQDIGAAGMGHVVRTGAPYIAHTVNQRTQKADLTSNMREEHNFQASKAGSMLLFSAMNGTVNEDFVVIKAVYGQSSITIKNDDIINNGSKSIFDESLKLKNNFGVFKHPMGSNILQRIISGELNLDTGLVSIARLAIQGINLNQLKLNKNKQIVTEYFGVDIDIKNLTDQQIDFLVPYQNMAILGIMDGRITKARASKSIKAISNIVLKNSLEDIKTDINIQKAVNNRTRFSRSPEKRGMSTFDFDDTLAKTKSGVRATVPNADGLPKPKRKVIFLAGGAGSGKGNVVSKLNLSSMGFKIVNSDISLEWLKKNSGLPADMRDLTPAQRSTLGKLGAQSRKIARNKMMKYQGNADGVVVDGTGGSVKSMQKLVDEFKSKGYDVSMIFVDTSLDIALERNRARQERSLLDSIVKRNHEAVQNNKSDFKQMFGDRFMEVNTDNLTQSSQMPLDLVNNVEDFVISYEKLRLDAEEFATQGDEILDKGGSFDFTEFNEVVDGTPGPLLEKARQRINKFGNKDVFVLTARPQASAQAIQEFLKSQGINIPIENITGLANSTGEAKAKWMLEKFSEGYNDMYFVDDALQNVEAVRDVLNQLDAKSEVVQAKTKFSKTASQEFNKIIEESKGTKADRVISQQEALKMGRNKNWFRLFVPPSAEDFKGLLYRFLGKGKQGERHMAWFKTNLLDPFSKGIREWNTYKQSISNEYKALKKQMPSVVKLLNKKVGDTVFTVDSAIRVYLWDKFGFDIPGITPEIKAKLIAYVNENLEVKAFADTLSTLSKVPDGYIQPNKNWSLETIASDLNNIVNNIGRKQFLQDYLANVEAIFTPDNMNKIQALYGIEFREALENILFRMENGTNRLQSNDRTTNAWLGWINGSIGAIMFFNMRSALLQTISTANFINWSDNNVFKAAAAFANQKQFWKDFAMLFNSPQLKQRRAGLQTDVSASELANTFAEGGNTYLQKANAVIKYLLQIGFTPTQIADSFAISLGGSTFYRNRFNTYKKQGLSDAQANEKAMLDFQEIAEETQQSSREDLVSQQQASTLGRLILAFQNVTMQYTRLTKKAFSDLVNRRGDMKTNMSKLIYYGMVQSLIFNALQTALVFMLFGLDEEEDKEKKKIERVANGALDSLLRGTGIFGAVIATVKNVAMRYQEEKKKGWYRDDGRIIIEALQLSPPIGSKFRKIYNAIKTEQYNPGVSKEIGLRIENPNLVAISNAVEAATNIPMARIVKKANNVEEAITGQHAIWQRIALFMGWSRWDIGVKDEELEAAKKAVKDKRKKEKNKDKPPRVRCTAIKKSGGRCKNTTKNKNKRCYAHQ